MTCLLVLLFLACGTPAPSTSTTPAALQQREAVAGLAVAEERMARLTSQLDKLGTAEASLKELEAVTAKAQTTDAELQKLWAGIVEKTKASGGEERKELAPPDQKAWLEARKAEVAVKRAELDKARAEIEAEVAKTKAEIDKWTAKAGSQTDEE